MITQNTEAVIIPYAKQTKMHTNERRKLLYYWL